jgi:hypothetical protein
MILLPFIHVSKKGSFGTVHSFKLFLANGGTQFWKTEEDTLSIEDIRREYLEPNGFSEACVKECGSIILIKLPPLFSISEYYSWEETTESVDLWRTFYWMETENEIGWEKQGDQIKIENFSLTQIWRLISADLKKM